MQNIIASFCAALLLLSNAQAQDAMVDTTWVFHGFFSQQFNQASFTNWAAGGENSLSTTSILALEANYKSEPITWENRLNLAYGIIKNENLSARKNEDKIDFLTRLGRSISQRMMISAQANLRTQFDRGFNYPNDSVLVSRFMAPGYLLIALGMDYRPVEYFSVFFSPASGKFTFVLDDFLSQQGAYGVEPGENVRSEFGAMLSLILTREILENVQVSSKLDLFNAYSAPQGSNPWNTDVNWETNINMKINRFLTTSLLFHLVYDDNIPIPIYQTIGGQRVQVGTGPRTQFKQLLGLGFSYNF